MRHAFWIRNGHPHDPAACVALAEAAEAGGWDGVFLSDAVGEAYGEPFTELAAIAARTSRLVLGTWVIPLVARDVVAVARAAAQVDMLSGGRLLLGIGLGNADEHDALGVPRTGLATRHDAALDVLDRLLRGETVTREDDLFALRGVRLAHAPLQQPRPPILLAASWPARAPVVRAARWDGLMPQSVAVWGDDAAARRADLEAAVAAYREAGGDGDLVVPLVAGADAAELAALEALGRGWLLHCGDLDEATLRAGPGAG